MLDPEALASPETPWQEFLRIFQKDYQALLGKAVSDIYPFH